MKDTLTGGVLLVSSSRYYEYYTHSREVRAASKSYYKISGRCFIFRLSRGIAGCFLFNKQIQALRPGNDSESLIILTNFNNQLLYYGWLNACIDHLNIS